MQFSSQATHTIELIEKDLTENLIIDTIMEQGQFNDYMFTKYYTQINKREVFDKIISEALSKNGYKIIKVGSGNFITNPQRFKATNEQQQVVKYETKKCPYCET